MSEIKLGKIYKATTKNKDGEPWDYVIPLYYSIHDYVEMEYIGNGNRGIIEIERFHQRYELA